MKKQILIVLAGLMASSAVMAGEQQARRIALPWMNETKTLECRYPKATFLVSSKAFPMVQAYERDVAFPTVWKQIQDIDVVSLEDLGPSHADEYTIVVTSPDRTTSAKSCPEIDIKVVY